MEKTNGYFYVRSFSGSYPRKEWFEVAFFPTESKMKGIYALVCDDGRSAAGRAATKYCYCTTSAERDSANQGLTDHERGVLLRYVRTNGRAVDLYSELLNSWNIPELIYKEQ